MERQPAPVQACCKHGCKSEEQVGERVRRSTTVTYQGIPCYLQGSAEGTGEGKSARCVVWWAGIGVQARQLRTGEAAQAVMYLGVNVEGFEVMQHSHMQ